MQEAYIQLGVGQIGVSLESLRIICPRAEAVMRASMQRYGQISPVVVGAAPDGYQMVDGFKRLRAARKLAMPHLDARVLPGSPRVWKTAMIQFNTRVGSIAELDQALVVRSLYREEKLSQIEIAALLNRHKSWVSRRLSLVENLCAEVIEHISLGLICITCGRELSRLPRGNQLELLRTVEQCRLTSRDTARLVAHFLSTPHNQRENLLRLPPDGACRTSRPFDVFFKRMVKIELWLTAVPGGLTGPQRRQLSPVVASIRASLNQLEPGHDRAHP